MAERIPWRFVHRGLRLRVNGVVALLVLIASWPLCAQPVGVMQEAVCCENEPDQSYALYLPSGYTNERAWPIIYCFDPRAWGKTPVERFQSAAERFGFIVVGSNNSMNGSWEGSETAARAMVRDTHRRFKIDDSRVYAAGFSGGARVACAIAAQWHFAGVLASGASFPESTVPPSVPFVFYGCAGRADFNYGELKRVNVSLGQMRVPHRIVFHEGAHDWIPASMAAEALGWLELQAMRRGLRSRDDALIDTLFHERMNMIRASRQDAQICFESVSIVADFEGLVDVTEPAGNVARLKDSEAMRKYLKAEKKADRQEKRFLDRLAEAAAAPPRASRTLSQIGDEDRFRNGNGDPFASRSDQGESPFGRERESAPHDWARQEFDRMVALRAVDPHEVLREVAADIQHQARSNVAAFRALNCFAGMLYEQGLAAEHVGEHQKAMHAFEMSTIVWPESGWSYLLLARACAHVGEKEKGRAALAEARAHGFPDEKRLSEVEQILKN